ncbi:MAG TPA: GlsB/YeaQ/YmgE family stress response membrane protein [Solirubrobacteraceae bacterium]
MIGAILLGLVAGIVGRMLVPDMWSGLSGPKSWLFSLVLGLCGALVGYLIFTVGLGIGDDDVFDFGGVFGAIIGVIILLPFVGIATRFARRRA